MRQPYLYLDGNHPTLMVCGQTYRLSRKELESLAHDIQMAEMFLSQPKTCKMYKEVKEITK
jgi:hypothetical protein